MNNIKRDILFLEYNEIKSLVIDGRLLLKCLEGQVWITVTGDPLDYVLDKGMNLEFTKNQDSILLQGLSSRVTVEVVRDTGENHSLLEAM